MLTTALPVMLLTGVVAAVLTHLVREISIRFQLFDVPNARSSHAAPTPRLGGIAIAGAALGGYGVGLAGGLTDLHTFWLWSTAAAAAALGLADDLHGIRPAVKLVSQLLIAGAAFYYAAPLLRLDVLWTCLAVLSTVAFANLFNFMDGSDGLAAGMAILFAFGLTTLSPDGTAGERAFVAGVTAGAAGGFLLLNWNPASIFMGDTGSLFLGFLLAALSWQLISAGVEPIAVALVFLPFGADTGWTLLKRACRRERVWTAHRSHIYQRLLIADFSHRSVAFLYYAWAGLAVVLAGAYAGGSFSSKIIVLFLAVASIVCIELLVMAREKRHPRHPGCTPSSAPGATPLQVDWQ